MENSKKVFWGLTAVLLGAVMLVFFGKALLPGKVLFGTDMFTIYLPFKIFAKQMLTQYADLPLWMPHLFFGVPLLASSSLLYFYPTDLIAMFLPIEPQYLYVPDMMIHMFLAFLGMFLYMRQTGARREAALFAGTVFMVSGFMMSYIYVGHWNNIKAGALIPLIFYFTEKGLSEKRLLHLLNAGIFLALQVLATGMQIMAYTLLGTGLLAVYRAWQSRSEKGAMPKLLMLFAASVAAAAVFSALQLLPSLPYTDFSWRGSFTYNDFISWSIHPLETLSFILPQVFGLSDRTYFGGMPFNLTTYYFGIIPLLFVPFAFMGKKRKEALFLSAASVLFLILAFGGFTPLYKIFYYVPIFKQFRNPSRFIYVMTFFVTVLSGMGLNAVLEAAADKNDGGAKKFFRAVSITAGALALFFLVMAAGPVTGFVSGLYRAIKGAAIPAEIAVKVSGMARADMLAFAALAAAFLLVVWLMLSGRLKSALAAALLLCVLNFADVYRIEKKFVIMDDYSKYVQAKDPVADVLRQDKDIYRAADFSFAWGPNRNVYHGIEGVKGMHGLIPSDYMNMEQSGIFNILGADRYFNIKYFIFPSDTAIQGLEKVYDGNVKVYRDTGAQPRFAFKEKGIKARDKAQALEMMKNGAVNIYTTAVSTEVIDLPESGDELSYKVAVLSYTPNSIKLKVDAGKPGIFILKNLYYPDWKVKVDNIPGKIYNVDYAFMGVVLMKGMHDVEFYYSRTTVAWGAVLTLLAIFGYILILLRDRRQKTKDRSSPAKKPR
ncbi:MAG: YfhO family protein [Spirochaetia bacterium]|nr:YfhO family protein [Spirochaetia bacterium]